MNDETIEPMDDEQADETATSIWTAQECADEIGVNAKALRDVMRKYCRANELRTPGSGGRWAVDVPVDEAERAAYFDWMRDLYASTGRTTNATMFKRVTD